MATAIFELGNVQIDQLTEPPGGPTPVFGDTITAPGIDAPPSSVFNLGTTNATAINLGHTGLTTYIYGSSLFIGNTIDAITAGTLTVGGSNANTLLIGTVQSPIITIGSYNTTGTLPANTYTESLTIQAQGIKLIASGSDGYAADNGGFDLYFDNQNTGLTNGDGIIYKGIGMGSGLFSGISNPTDGYSRVYVEVGQGASTAQDFLVNAMIRGSLTFAADSTHNINIQQSFTGDGYNLQLNAGNAATGSGGTGGEVRIDGGAKDGAGSNGAVSLGGDSSFTGIINIGNSSAITNIFGTTNFDPSGTGKTFSVGAPSLGFGMSGNTITGNTATAGGQLKLVGGGVGNQNAQLILDSSTGAQLLYTTSDKIVIDTGGIHMTAPEIDLISAAVTCSPNAIISNISQAATNTAAMTIAPNVADGASSVGLLVNNTTALSTGTLAQFQNAGSVRASIVDIGGGIGALYLGTKTSNDYVFGGNSTVTLRAGGISNFQITTTQANLAANGTLGNMSQGATNTTAMTLAPNVADGASSIALKINNATTLATGKLISIQNNGTERFTFTDNAGSSAFKINSTTFATNSGGNVFTITSSNFFLELGASGLNQVAIGGSAPYAMFPVTNNGPTLGTSSANWSNVYAATYSVTAAGSISNTAQGATNTTGITIAPNVADGATSVGLKINSTTSLATSGAQLVTFSNAGTLESAINNIGTYNNGGAGFRPGATSYWDSAYATPKYTWTASAFAPFTDKSVALGANTTRFSNVWSTNLTTSGTTAGQSPLVMAGSSGVGTTQFVDTGGSVSVFNVTSLLSGQPFSFQSSNSGGFKFFGDSTAGVGNHILQVIGFASSTTSVMRIQTGATPGTGALALDILNSGSTRKFDIDPSGNVTLHADASTAGTTTQPSPILNFEPHFWSGSDQAPQVSLQAIIDDPAGPLGHLGISFGGLETFQFTSDSIAVLPRVANNSFTVTTTSGSITIDPTNGDYQRLTLTAAATSITVSAGHDGEVIRIKFQAAGFSATTWNNVLWPGGTTPSWSANTDMITFIYDSSQWLLTALELNLSGAA